MPLVSWLIDLFFGAVYGWAPLYGWLIGGLAFAAAIPYGAWQGAKRIWAMRPGGNDGHTRTG